MLLSEKQVNIYTGKAQVGALSKEEQLALVNHIDALERKLTELDEEDYFGTDGWRHIFGVPDSDS
jgi:hypothetical protein